MINAKLVKELREITGAGMLDCKKALEETNGNIEKAIDFLREKGISKAAKKSNRIAAEGLTAVKEKNNTAAIIEVNSETDFVSMNESFLELINNIIDVILEDKPKDMKEALNCKINDESVSELITKATATIGEKIDFRRFMVLEKNDNQIFGSYSHLGGKISSLVVLDGNNSEVAKDIAIHIAASAPRYLNEQAVDNDVLEKEKSILTEQAMNEGKPKEIAEKIVAGRINKFLKEICLIDQIFIKDPDLTVDKYVKNNDSNIVSFVRYEVGEGIEKKETDFAKEVEEAKKV